MLIIPQIWRFRTFPFASLIVFDDGFLIYSYLKLSRDFWDTAKIVEDNKNS